MPEFLSPQALARERFDQYRPIAGVSTSAYGVIGEAIKGLVNQPILVTSFDAFVSQFGSFTSNSLLAYDVYQFFQQGGERCYVIRVDGALSATASLSVNNRETSAEAAWLINAVSPGAWGNDLAVTISQSNKLKTLVNGAASEDDVELILDKVTGSCVGTILKVGKTAQVQDVEAVADTSDSLDGTYFTLPTAHDRKTYALWFNTSGGSATAPTVSGATLVEVAIATGATASAVGDAIETAIGTTAATGLPEFTASNSSGTVTITHVNAGSATAAAEGSGTGFTFNAPSATGADHMVKLDNVLSSSKKVFFSTTYAIPSGGIPDNASVTSLEFDISVYYQGELVEQFFYMGTESENTLDYADNVLKRSAYIRWGGSATPAPTYSDANLALKEKQPAAVSSSALSGGVTDTAGVSTSTLTGALTLFDSVDESLALGIPDDQSATAGLAGDAYAEGREDCVFIKSTPAGYTAQTAKDFLDDAGYNTSYGCVYWPWIYVADPETNLLLSLPAIGAAAGVWARTDNAPGKGVAKAPAGVIDGRLRNVLDLSDGNSRITLGKGDYDIIYPAPTQANPIRKKAGPGVHLWGSRTGSVDSATLQLSHRRYLIYLRKSLTNGIEWVVFENNNAETWAKVRLALNGFMLNEFRAGSLRGDTADDAFFVVCDQSTNPESQIRQGILKAQVGVALQQPAEFVLVDIVQNLGALEAELAAEGISV